MHDGTNLVAIALDRPEEPGIDRRQRDFMLLAAHVLATQGKAERAALLVEALLAFRPSDPEALFAAAVLDFSQGRFLGCRERLADLDRIAPLAPPRSRASHRRLRARLYLAASTARHLGLADEAREALAAYLASAPPEPSERG